MFSEERLFEILDSAVKDISHRVVKLDVVNMPENSCVTALQPCNIHTKTNGDYEMTFVLCTDYQVLKEMTRNMKRGAEASEEDVPLYMQEFLNILCGHIVSKMNKRTNLKVFFDVPCFVRGEFKAKNEDQSKFSGKYCYDSPYGSLELQVLCN